MLTLKDLEARIDLNERRVWVLGSMRRGLNTPEARLLFISRLGTWNGLTAAGGAALAARIISAREFHDPDQPVRALADRTHLVAGPLLGEVRDEVELRRPLQLSLLQGLLDIEAQAGQPWTPAQADGWMSPPHWLPALLDRMAQGYNGSTFRALGYHLCAVWLCAHDHFALDLALREADVHTVHSLQSRGLYEWVLRNPDPEPALEALNRALRFSAPHRREVLMNEALYGVDAFGVDHEAFFEAINR